MDTEIAFPVCSPVMVTQIFGQECLGTVTADLKVKDHLYTLLVTLEVNDKLPSLEIAKQFPRRTIESMEGLRREKQDFFYDEMFSLLNKCLDEAYGQPMYGTFHLLELPSAKGMPEKFLVIRN